MPGCDLGFVCSAKAKAKAIKVFIKVIGKSKIANVNISMFALLIQSENLCFNAHEHVEPREHAGHKLCDTNPIRITIMTFPQT